jgi:hypothetical protein
MPLHELSQASNSDQVPPPPSHVSENVETSESSVESKGVKPSDNVAKLSQEASESKDIADASSNKHQTGDSVADEKQKKKIVRST